MRDYYKIVVIHDLKTDKRIMSWARNAGELAFAQDLPQNESEEVFPYKIERFYFNTESHANKFIDSYLNIHYDTILVR